jgi:ribonuclease BN (tRNA processing enzyme)
MKPQVMLRVLGCGDAFGSGGRMNTCFVVDDPYGRFTLDFGATSLVALNAAGIDAATIELVVLSHLHSDHFGGLPNLLLYREFVATTKQPLTIAGPPGTEKRLRALHDCCYPGTWRDTWSFALSFVEVAPGSPVDLGQRHLVTAPVHHFAGSEPATALRVETAGKTIVYSGDTSWTENLVTLADGSDLFICECNDLQDQPYDGHLSYQTLSTHIGRLNTRRLVVTHMAPDMLVASETLGVEAAFDGMDIQL